MEQFKFKKQNWFTNFRYMGIHAFVEAKMFTFKILLISWTVVQPNK